MFKKLNEKLNSINTFSRKIIIWGAILSLAMCLIGFGIVTYNENVIQKLSLYTIGTSLVYSAIVLFSEFTAGGLVIDLANNFFKNHND